VEERESPSGGSVSRPGLTSRLACGAIGGAMQLACRSFPPIVRVETTNACNAKCIICPHSELKRPIVRMDDELFDRIIEECSGRRVREMHLHNFGEPLLDKKLEERVKAAKQAGLRKVKIFSNGALLNESRAAGLIEAGLDEIKISFDGASREEFEHIRRPLRYDEVVENIKQLVRLRNEAGSRMRVKVACCSTTDRDATMRSLEEIVDGFSFGKIHNWHGEGTEDARNRIRRPCSRLWRTLTILSDGRVALCCLDYDGKCILGRLDRGETIEEIWNGAAYRYVRGKHVNARQAELPLCDNCSKAFF